MKRKSKKIRLIALLMCSIMLLGTLTACTGSGNANAEKPADSETAATSAPDPASEQPETTVEAETLGYTRIDLEADLADAKQRYDANPDDSGAVYEYAQLLYQNADFEAARTILDPLLQEESPAPEIVYTAANVEYVLGNYAKAEELYRYLVQNHNEDMGLAAEAGLQMVYYQTNEYSKASGLFAGQDFENSFLDMMKAFGDDTPYEMDWHGQEEAIVPFVVGDPLPVVPIEINGVRLNAVIDTGAPMLLVEETIASDIGIESISKDIGEGASGADEIAYGKAGSVNLGGIDIQNIPVLIASVQGFSGYFDIELNAIVGTNFLQQFMPIMDYATGQLVLIPRTEEGKNHTEQLLSEERILEEIPFSLAATHYMYAKGSLNGYENLNMFIDSGLEDVNGESVVLSKLTMELLNIPIPELSAVPADKGGLGEEGFESGRFGLSSCGIGNLQQTGGLGVYDTSDVVSVLTNGLGIMSDVLISHGFVKHYKWFMDFDSMTMTFCEK